MRLFPFKLVAFFSFFTAGVAFPQSRLCLRPYMGMGSGFCFYKVKPEVDDWFQLKKYGDNSLNPLKNIQAGLLIENNMNKKFGFSSGVTTGIASYSYNFFIGQRSRIDTLSNGTTQTSVEKNYFKYSRSIRLIRLPVNISYCLMTVPNKYKQDSLKKQASPASEKLNKLEIIGGASFNYAVSNLEPLSPQYPHVVYMTVVYDNDTIKHVANNRYQSKFGISVNGGVRWNIYRKSKQITSLTLYYEQGIINMVNADLTFSKNSETRIRKIRTKGSQLHFNLSFPISL